MLFRFSNHIEEEITRTIETNSFYKKKLEEQMQTLEWLNQKIVDAEDNLSKNDGLKSEFGRKSLNNPISRFAKPSRISPLSKYRVESALVSGNLYMKPSFHRKSQSTLGLINRRTLTEQDLHISSDSLVSRQHHVSLRPSSKDHTNSSPNLFVS